MSRPRTAAFFSHLAIALSGTALAIAELDFLPEVPLILACYLAFVTVAWRAGGRFALPTWAVNTLGLMIAGLASAWIASRLGDEETNQWMRDVPLPVAIVPFLGPMLLGLTVVRLYCPRSPADFWPLQGLGLLQVALGCVLSSGALFGGALLTYLIVAMCALASHERHRQAGRSTDATADVSLGGWVAFGLRWTFAVSLLALPLFLLTPRAEGPEWEPWARFGYRQPAAQLARVGFSEEIDLNRTGALLNDDSVAFQVTVTEADGRPVSALPGDQRWRGVVLDRYEGGKWRNGLSWTRPQQVTRHEDPACLYVQFKVPGKVGGLFLAEPIQLGPEENALPVWQTTSGRPSMLFHEFAGTVIPIVGANYMTRSEYRYTQSLPRGGGDRTPARRPRGLYLQQLIDNRPGRLVDWTRGLLLKLAAGDRYAALRQALQANAVTGDTLPPDQWESVAYLLRDHLARSSEYSYSLSFRRVSMELDPSVDFLLNVREGPCERFATGLALMLRSAGVPARVIKGFRGAEETGIGTYQVRNRQAHAWVEAMVLSGDQNKLNFDWVMLDPTPDSEATGQNATALSRLWQLQQTGQELWQDLIVGYGPTRQADLWNDLFESARWRTLLPAAVAAAAAVAALLLWRRRRRSRLEQAGAAALYARLTEVLARRLTLVARSDETPRELAGRAEEAMRRRAATGEAAAAPGLVVELYYESRFGGRTPEAAALAAARSGVAALEAALAK